MLRDVTVEATGENLPGPSIPVTIDGTPLTVCGIEETFRVHVRPRGDLLG